MHLWYCKEVSSSMVHWANIAKDLLISHSDLVAPPAVHQPLQGVPAAAHVLQAPLLLQVRVVPQQLVQT